MAINRKTFESAYYFAPPFVRSTLGSTALYRISTTKVIKTKKADEEAQKYKDYFNWDESLNRIPSHRLLAILRAEKEGFIRVKISVDDERALERIENKIIKNKNS